MRHPDRSNYTSLPSGAGGYPFGLTFEQGCPTTRVRRRISFMICSRRLFVEVANSAATHPCAPERFGDPLHEFLGGARQVDPSNALEIFLAISSASSGMRIMHRKEIAATKART